MKKKTGFYIHIPFCHSKCSYCDFYSISDFNDKIKSDYIQRLEQNIKYMAERFSSIYKPDTLFIGGGTPSVYSPQKLQEIINIVQKEFNCNPHEITVEINPNLIDMNFINELRKTHVNRLSFGLQSPFKNDNDYLGRKFSRKSLDIIKYSLIFFENVSVDIVCGYEGFNSEKIIKRLKEYGILDKITHISLYMLKYSKSFCSENPDRKCDEDRQVEDYEDMIKLLEDNKFSQYEISNFSRSGFKCSHNLHYWKYDDYLGAGAGACIKIEDKIVCFPEVDRYMKGDFKEFLEDFEKTGENPDKLIMGMRLCEGMSFKDLKKIHNNLPDIMKMLYNRYKDYFCIDEKNISFSKKGLLFSNSLLSIIMDIMEENR